MKPKLKLKVNIEADIENAKWFVKNGHFVDMFLPTNFQYVMSERFSQSERNKIITEYTKHIYKINKKEILEGTGEIEKQWLKIEDNFYELIDALFKGYAWPKGKYIGYASVYLMFPRDVQEKIFYFPYNAEKWNPLGTIAHELLHFIFFDYIEKRYGIKENDKIKGKNPKYIWQVSEAFNVVIENWKPYMEIFNTEEKSETYDHGCKKVYDVMEKQWSKKQDIDSLLDKWFLKVTSFHE